MPTLEIDDQVITQSNAIYRYLATEFGLYGANSQEKAVIDQISENLKDMTNDLVKIVYYSGFDEETSVSPPLHEKIQKFYHRVLETIAFDLLV